MIHLNDPIIGQTHTKVGETHYTDEISYHMNDPIVGQTETKIDETVTTVHDYGTTYLDPSYTTHTTHVNYYPTIPQSTTTYVYTTPLHPTKTNTTYTHVNPHNNSSSSGLTALVLCVGLVGLAALMVYSAPTRDNNSDFMNGKSLDSLGKKTRLLPSKHQTLTKHMMGAPSSMLNMGSTVPVPHSDPAKFSKKPIYKPPSAFERNSYQTNNRANQVFHSLPSSTGKAAESLAGRKFVYTPFIEREKNCHIEEANCHIVEKNCRKVALFYKKVCDKVQVCNQHLSGAQSCYLTEKNCRQLASSY